MVFFRFSIQFASEKVLLNHGSLEMPRELKRVLISKPRQKENWKR